MPLVYLPDRQCLFAWGADALPAGSEVAGKPLAAALVTPAGRREVEGTELPLVETMTRLAAVPAAHSEALPASVATWVLASKLALDLVARERVIPTIARRAERVEARWAAALSGGEDAAKVAALARSMPPAAHAVPIASGSERDVWAPDALLRAYLDAAIDALVRAVPAQPEQAPEAHAWDRRWQAALAGSEPSFELRGFVERSLVDELARWSAPALGARDRLRACFRLELPEGDTNAFHLLFLLQSPDDPSLLVSAAEVWANQGRSLERFGRAFRDPQESLLEALARAARLYPALEPALESRTPEGIALDPAAAWEFLAQRAELLSEAGFGVLVPGELTRSGQRRLRARMRIGGKAKVAGAVAGSAGLGLDELLAVDWQAVVGDDVLGARELAALAKHKAPLVRFRGAWVAVDPKDLSEIRKRIARGPSLLSAREALQAALAGETRAGELAAGVVATGVLAELLERLRQGAAADITVPKSLNATLRPYQERGLRWLATLGALGLGACLADDMGLGKTVQLLAYLLHRAESAEAAGEPQGARPCLLVAPTSVVGNWEREVARFAPGLELTRHYGSTRARSAAEFPASPRALVLTTYGLLRRDAELLASVDWSIVALDEAQNIKNAASSAARAARALRAGSRVALTGTPVENRLAELWSILEFANPGLLGPLEAFRRTFAVPIERYANEGAAERLRRVVSPFVLRREKRDPNVLADLPDKHEMKVVCSLTREQASLYKAVVDEELRRIEQAAGMEKKGRVLALLTFTKQICNHPAQYLSERGPLPKRSGKLERLHAMLEEALAAGDKALVFTQFFDMGEKLAQHLAASFATEVPFLHGGTPKAARDAMVSRFQEDARGPRIFVLSLKAGGTGLNLTAANHVFHYDRWWNPAVEDQATDRAHRIGQTRAVQVHKLLCAGTVEEKIDHLLEHKRALAAKVVGRGEQWITELGTDDLRELFTLSERAAAVADEDGPEEVGTAPPRSKRGRARRREAQQ